MADLSEEQLRDVKDVFCYFDTKGDDKIAIHQVGDALRALGQHPTEADIEKCCANWRDQDSRMAIEEFLPIYQQIISTRKHRSADEFVRGLSLFDKEGNGSINIAELRRVLTTAGERLSDEEADQLLTGQEDTNGNVNIGDFVRHVLNG